MSELTAMEIKLSQLMNAKIIYQEEICGILQQILITENTVKISGIKLANKKFFQAENIVSFSADKIILNSDTPQKDSGINWKNLNVKSSNGKKYGKVDDLWINQNELRINKFSTSTSFFGLFKLSKRIFSVSRVLEIKEKNIIINDESDSKIDVNLAKNVSFS